MAERLTRAAEFLRRALSWGREGDPRDAEVTPEALPPGFPVTLPELERLRVLGGGTSAFRG